MTDARVGDSVPATRYARSGDLNIAYQAFGTGPVDLVMVPGFISHIEFAWQEPLLARFLRKLSTFTRVITFDKRGMGMSDRDRRRETPSLAERMDDICSVMDTAGCRRAALLAWSEGGATSLLFARRRPERVAALVLLGTTARFTADADFPEGIPREFLEIFINTMRQDWGSGVGFELYAPSMADDARMRSWWASYQRFASSPGAVAASLRMHLDVDVREVLPNIAVPTLVMHRTCDMLIPVECARSMAARIAGARYVEQPGEDHMYWLGDQDSTLTAIRQFLAADAGRGSYRRPAPVPTSAGRGLGEPHRGRTGRRPAGHGGHDQPADRGAAVPVAPYHPDSRQPRHAQAGPQPPVRDRRGGVPPSALTGPPAR